MSLEVDVQYTDAPMELEEEPPSSQQFRSWAELVLQKPGDYQLAIRVVDEQESQQLNAEYRGKDKPTNVLSFPMEMPEQLEEQLLGDLVICAPVVEQEAHQQNKPVLSHWAHMVIHGMLHLQGFDHETEAEAEAMESREIQLLQQLGIDNPYITL